MKWDHGLRNSYRMGAENKFDLKLANSENLSNFDLSSASSVSMKKGNPLNNRKSSSTPSLPEATDCVKTSVASTDQAASVDNLRWNQTGKSLESSNEQQAAEVSVSHSLHLPDLSTINTTSFSLSDLATITENLTLSSDDKNISDVSNAGESSTLSEEKASNLNEANNKINLNQSSSSISKTLLNTKLEMLDKIDMLRNNTNSLLSSGILSQSNLLSSVKLSLPRTQDASSNTTCNNKTGNINEDSRIKKAFNDFEKYLQMQISEDDTTSNSLNQSQESANTSIVSNVSSNDSIGTTSLLDTLSLARRDSNLNVNNNNIGNLHCSNNHSGIAGGSMNNVGEITPISNSSYLRGSGGNSVTSLVKLALSSSNFNPGLLGSAVQNISNNTSSQSNVANQSLTMSLTSASSDSEQVSLEDFLESCRPPALLGESDDFDDLEDETVDDENEDEYEEVGNTLLQVMVSRNLLSFMDEEGIENRLISAGKRKSWDDEYVLKRSFSALIPAFDPRPGRTNVNQTSDIEIPSPGSDCSDQNSKQAANQQISLHLVLKGPNMNGINDMEIPLVNNDWTIFRAVQDLIQMTNMPKQDKLKKIWEPTFTIIYREAKRDQSNALDEGRSTPIISVASEGSTLSPSSPVQMPATPTNNVQCTVEDVLQLLGQINSIDQSINSALEPDSPQIPHDLYISKKITNKLLQQIQDPLVLASSSLPMWCEDYNQSCPFLFSFETRQVYFNFTAFGASRSIVCLQSQKDVTLERQRAPGLSPRHSDQHEFRVGRLKHERVKVPRTRDLLSWAMQVMKFHCNRKSVLEIEFQNEEGTGMSEFVS